MEKSVIITVCGLQSYEGAEDDTIELVTEGRLTDYGGGTLTLSYQESELTGMEGTETVIHMEEDGKITLLRTGRFNSQMIFEAGERHLTLYQTPYGDLAVGVRTERLKNTMNMEGGELEIAYGIEVDDVMTGKSLLKIKVRENGRKRAARLSQ